MFAFEMWRGHVLANTYGPWVKRGSRGFVRGFFVHVPWCLYQSAAGAQCVVQGAAGAQCGVQECTDHNHNPLLDELIQAYKETLS